MLLCAQSLYVVECLDYNITPQITEKHHVLFKTIFERILCGRGSLVL